MPRILCCCLRWIEKQKHKSFFWVCLCCHVGLCNYLHTLWQLWLHDVWRAHQGWYFAELSWWRSISECCTFGCCIHIIVFLFNCHFLCQVFYYFYFYFIFIFGIISSNNLIVIFMLFQIITLSNYFSIFRKANCPINTNHPGSFSDSFPITIVFKSLRIYESFNRQGNL